MQSTQARWSVGMLVSGKYALLRVIGQGGFASVYEAENGWTGRRVAIKVLHALDARFHEAAGRFMREARVTAQLAHPNVVDILDMGEEPSDGSLFIVQELLKGRTLRDHLKAKRRLAPAEALAVLVPVVEALVAAHDRGVVHRDIKPENIFLTERPHGRTVPKLIDFGVSKVFDDSLLRSGGTIETLAGTLVGTPEYMSPEQCLGDAEIDARADVWAVGVVLYEALAGRCPFEGTTVVRVLTRITSQAPPPLGTLVKNLPPGLTALVHRALERDREHRFPTMRALRDALAEVAATLGSEPDAPALADDGDDDEETQVFVGAKEPTASGIVAPPSEPPRAESRVQPSPDIAYEPLDVFELGTLEPPSSVGPASLGRIDVAVLTDPDAEPPADTERVAYCVRCAEQCLAINALQHSVSWAERGLALGGASDAERGRLLLSVAVARGWLGEPLEALESAREAMQALGPARERYWDALGERAAAAGELGRVDELVELATLLTERTAAAQADAPLVAAACRVATQLLRAGRGDLSRKLRAATRNAARRLGPDDAALRARVAEADGAEGLHAGDPSAFLEHFRAAAQAFAEAGDVRNSCAQRANVGDAYRQLGDYPEAERALRAALALAEPMGLHIVAAIECHLGAVLARLGATGEARRVGTEALAAFEARHSRRGEAFARSHLAATLFRMGELEAAEAMAQRAIEAATDAPGVRPFALATLANVLLAAGRPEAALEPAEIAKQLIKAQGGAEEGETLARVVHIEALIATKAHPEQIRGHVFKASMRLVRRAQRISNERWRASFMSAVEENARTLALSGQWLDSNVGSLVDDAVTEI
ncbi:MAG: protein kinase [Polyangiaceae bacterium]|nr:protein kinase [Polyangiaceae bacterium]